jgi:hypothetical protein
MQGEIVTAQANLLGKTVSRFTYVTHAICKLLVHFTQRITLAGHSITHISIQRTDFEGYEFIAGVLSK